MFQLDNELKALDEAHAPRLKYFQPVILGGYTKGVPSEVKLWDSKPIFPDDLEPAQREVKFHKNLEFLAEQMSANEEQVEATKRAYGASAGLSLVHGGPKTGKTVTALLQALVAVSMGHKVILCAPAGSIDDLESLFGKHWSKMPDDDKPNVYIARSPASETYLTKYCELAAASNDPDCTMPATLGHGVWKALRENIRIFKTTEKQALYKNHQQYHPSLQHPVESQLLWDLMPTIRADPHEDDYKRFLHLYNKVYFRVIAEADIIITSCHSAGVEELYSHFRPTVAIVDSCNLAAEPEALIPLLMYKDIRFRILLGNRGEVHPHTLPANDPYAVWRQFSLLERLARTDVPVYEMKHQFTSLQANQQDEVSLEGIGGGGRIARNKPCPCGSRRKYKKCCGADEK